jgi:pimeloyl-ACP methyl ester carboxylesterase
VVALTLPGLSYGSPAAGLGLADAVDHVIREIEQRDLAEVMLVGHSWGGYPATGAAQKLAGRIRTLVFYNARPGTEFAARLGVPPVLLPGGYMTLLSRPAVVADALVSLL